MIVCNVDASGRVLTISYNRHVGAVDMQRCLETVRELMPNLKPGFFLMADLSNLDSMEPSCATALGEIMELCSAKGLAAIARIIPDASKDIGFDLISQFHLDPKVRTQTHGSLAEAVQSLLSEVPPADEPAEISMPAPLDREKEDALAEAHFTTEARKEIEVNEGGLVEKNIQPLISS